MQIKFRDEDIDQPMESRIVQIIDGNNLTELTYNDIISKIAFSERQINTLEDRIPFLQTSAAALKPLVNIDYLSTEQDTQELINKLAETQEAINVLTEGYNKIINTGSEIVRLQANKTKLGEIKTAIEQLA